MADVRCPSCGEPFDADEWHDWEGPEGQTRTYDENRKAFFEGDTTGRVGCEAIGLTHNDVADGMAATVAAAAYDLMGDDVDGIAMMLDDASYMGLI